MITKFIVEHWFISGLVVAGIIYHFSKRNEVEYDEDDD